MITVLAIIMSVMILVLAILIAGVAILALDTEKAREFNRILQQKLDRDRRAFEKEKQDWNDANMMTHYNDIVNNHL